MWTNIVENSIFSSRYPAIERVTFPSLFFTAIQSTDLAVKTFTHYTTSGREDDQVCDDVDLDNNRKFFMTLCYV